MTETLSVPGKAVRKIEAKRRVELNAKMFEEELGRWLKGVLGSGRAGPGGAALRRDGDGMRDEDVERAHREMVKEYEELW